MKKVFWIAGIVVLLSASAFGGCSCSPAKENVFIDCSTKTVKYRLREMVGQTSWWHVDKLVDCEWKEVSIFCNIDGVDGARQEFEDKYLRKRKIFIYTGE